MPNFKCKVEFSKYCTYGLFRFWILKWGITLKWTYLFITEDHWIFSGQNCCISYMKDYFYSVQHVEPLKEIYNRGCHMPLVTFYKIFRILFKGFYLNTFRPKIADTRGGTKKINCLEELRNRPSIQSFAHSHIILHKFSLKLIWFYLILSWAEQ